MIKTGYLYLAVKSIILKKLAKNKGGISKTAGDLGLTRRGLQLKLQEYRQQDIILKKTEEECPADIIAPAAL